MSEIEVTFSDSFYFIKMLIEFQTVILNVMIVLALSNSRVSIM